MFIPKDESPKFDPCPAGTHMARCFRFVDLGSHEQKFQGESKGLKRLVMLSFEIPGELMEDGRPFTISKRYTWSMHEKSTLRKHLEAWRGRKFQDNEFGPGGFDIRNVIGKVCTISVVHKENTEGDIFANIDSIGAPIKGIEIPAQINPSGYVALDRAFFQKADYDALSDKLKEFIQQSPEWRRLSEAPVTKTYAEARGTPRDDPARDMSIEGVHYDEMTPPPPTEDELEAFLG
ncbi:MAG: hypothetical protein KGL39_51140 [Patescibacteria group bacterium]|nr:hypothetical protein [Patescibacteria group bacterium]